MFKLLILLLISINIFATEISLDVKKKKIYPLGEKIYKKKCQEIDVNKYGSQDLLNGDLKTFCKITKEKHLQALSLYLWEVKRSQKEAQLTIEIREKEKCPVCGMFVYKYPKWATQIYYQFQGKKHIVSFDGVKDLFKFYFSPNEFGEYPFANKNNIEKILVTDYYSQKVIDGKKAYYVIGSNIYGPMGHELISFENIQDAKSFRKDHSGRTILSFTEITEEGIYSLDNN